MSVQEVSIAAATAVLGYDLLQNTTLQRAGYDRELEFAALTGSAAAGDTIVDLFIDTVRVATLYNTTTGFPTGDHYKPIGATIPAGSLLRAIVTDAPGTNAINLTIGFGD